MVLAAACGPLPQPDRRAERSRAPDAPASPPARPTPAPLAIPTGVAAVRTGADLFVRAGCVQCHGDAGEGYVGPPIARTPLGLGAVVTQVRFPLSPKMPSFSRRQLSDEEVAFIYAFLQSLPPR